MAGGHSRSLKGRILLSEPSNGIASIEDLEINERGLLSQRNELRSVDDINRFLMSQDAGTEDAALEGRDGSVDDDHDCPREEDGPMPPLGRRPRHKADKLAGVVEEERVLAADAAARQLEPGLHAFDVEVDPVPQQAVERCRHVGQVSRRQRQPATRLAALRQRLDACRCCQG